MVDAPDQVSDQIEIVPADQLDQIMTVVEQNGYHVRKVARAVRVIVVKVSNNLARRTFNGAVALSTN